MRISQHNRFPRRLEQCPKCLAAHSLDVEQLSNGSVRHSCRVMSCGYLMIWKTPLLQRLDQLKKKLLKKKLYEDHNVDTILRET